jgi:hypothetical protein
MCFGLIGQLQVHKLVFQGSSYCRGFFFELAMCYCLARFRFVVLLVEFSGFGE